MSYLLLDWFFSLAASYYWKAEICIMFVKQHCIQRLIYSAMNLRKIISSLVTTLPSGVVPWFSLTIFLLISFFFTVWNGAHFRTVCRSVIYVFLISASTKRTLFIWDAWRKQSWSEVGVPLFSDILISWAKLYKHICLLPQWDCSCLEVIRCS